MYIFLPIVSFEYNIYHIYIYIYIQITKFIIIHKKKSPKNKNIWIVNIRFSICLSRYLESDLLSLMPSDNWCIFIHLMVSFLVKSCTITLSIIPRRLPGVRICGDIICHHHVPSSLGVCYMKGFLWMSCCAPRVLILFLTTVYMPIIQKIFLTLSCNVHMLSLFGMH